MITRDNQWLIELVFYRLKTEKLRDKYFSLLSVILVEFFVFGRVAWKLIDVFVKAVCFCDKFNLFLWFGRFSYNIYQFILLKQP